MNNIKNTVELLGDEVTFEQIRNYEALSIPLHLEILTYFFSDFVSTLIAKRCVKKYNRYLKKRESIVKTYWKTA